MLSLAIVFPALTSVLQAELVEECTCAQVSRCREDANKLFEACAVGCKFLLPGVGRRNQAVQCLSSEVYKSGGCFDVTHSDSCASGPGKMIDVSRVVARQQFLRRMGSYDQDIQVNAFFECVDRCVINKMLAFNSELEHSSCQELLSCGTLRRENEQAVKKHNACRAEICNCLAGAGMEASCGLQVPNPLGELA